MQHQALLDSSQQVQEQQQQAADRLRTQLATADLKVRKAGLDVQSLTQQVQKSQDELQVRPAKIENPSVCAHVCLHVCVCACMFNVGVMLCRSLCTSTGCFCALLLSGQHADVN